MGVERALQNPVPAIVGTVTAGPSPWNPMPAVNTSLRNTVVAVRAARPGLRSTTTPVGPILRSTVATAVPVPGNIIVTAGTGHRTTVITVARDLWNAVIIAGTGRRTRDGPSDHRDYCLERSGERHDYHRSTSRERRRSRDHRSESRDRHGTNVWESILGPKPTGAQEPEENLFTLDAFCNQPSTPSFKLDYSHPSYNLEQVDLTKRNLFQAPAQKPQLSSQTWQKVCNLDNPYELPTDEGASTSSAKGRDSAASLLYLSSRASAQFFADANMTLSFPKKRNRIKNWAWHAEHRLRRPHSSTFRFSNLSRPTSDSCRSHVISSGSSGIRPTSRLLPRWKKSSPRPRRCRRHAGNK